MTTGVIRLEANGPEDAGLKPMELDAADFQSPLPQQSVHVYFNDAEIGLSVGVWTTTDMQEAFGPYPGDEFMLVLEGRVEMMDGDDKGIPVETGQSFVIRNAIPISWKQVGSLRKFYITLLDPKAPTPEITSAEGGVIVLNEAALADRLMPEPESIGGGTQNDAHIFTNDAGTMKVGMWETIAFDTQMQAFSIHEFCQILAGKVTITEKDGTTHDFGPGDVFFVSKGTVCKWTSQGPVRKYYVQVSA
ncbi:cupin domain-containing protein [Roseovarius sp. 2305UL8-3]|uniref:cupin domain-containing protein n=1 Tax=Roseovarius conchicola TaxID=3121636 RepID=UPI0035271434